MNSDTLNSKDPKAVRLAQYLREVVLSKMTMVRDVERYDEVLWLDQIPDIEGCNHAAKACEPATAEDRDVSTWLQINDQDLPTPPEPPEDLRPWMKPQEYEHPRRDPPKLQTKATIDDPDWDPTHSDERGKVTVRLEDRPGIEELYQAYCTTWHDWAATLGERLRAQELYSKLYQIHRRLDREGETLQLCVGFGLLDWPKPGGKAARIRRHVVTATADLEFDPRLGAMRVACPSEGTRVALERDMLEREFDPSQSQTAEVEADLASISAEDAVWDQDKMHAALQTWGRLLAPKTKWSPGLSAEEGLDATPALSWAPAIILRKRGSSALLRLYKQIIDQLQDGKVPAGWGGLVDVTSDEIPSESNNPSHPNYWPDESAETYFPLPANSQQREIVEAVRTRRGVVVQGPPGTGKSHTIANLMCHLLASGQRVLVTAENPRALAVLRDKLPEELRPLCVSVLGQGGDAFEALSKTVREISSRRALWSEAQGQEEIAEVQRQLLEAKKALEAADRELRNLRLGETVKHDPAQGFHGTPQKIAASVSEQRGDHDWLDLGDSDTLAAPLTNVEVTRWLELLRDHDPEQEAELDDLLISLEKLPPSTELQDLLATAAERKRHLDEFTAEARAPGYGALVQLPEDDLHEVHEELHNLRTKWDEFPSTAWCREAAQATRLGDPGTWQVLLQRTEEGLSHVAELSEHLGERRVDVPAELDPERARNDAQIVLEHLNAGGKWKRALGLGRPKAIQGREYLRERVHVNSSPADEPHELEAVVHAMNRRLAIARLGQAWAAHAQSDQESDPETLLAQVKQWAGLLRHSIDVGTLDRDLRQRLQIQLHITLPEDWMTSREHNWLRVIDAARAEQDLQKAEQRIMTLADQIGATAQLHGSSRLVSDVHEAVRQRDVAGYGKAREQIARTWHQRKVREERQDLDARMVEHAKPLRDAVSSTPDDSSWPRHLATFEEAWAWHVADRWLSRFSEPGRIMVVERERKRADARVGELVTRLAAQMAWQKFFQRLEPRQDMALKSWLNTVKQMGKGKGRSAKLERLRRQARAHLEACRDAIPVWVMPRYLVAEMVSVSPERFDTVIVDEASQMGLDGMFVFYVGRRTVIVGDDQQISPSDVGLRYETIDELQRQHIPDLDHVNAMGLGGNVYANAQIRFSRLITLREHFRCMPEIIQFSNDLCYASQGTPLDPMRSYRNDRLPPLVAKRVAGGQREGGTSAPINRIEAQEIVNHIGQCLDDHRYDGMTFGIISLVGNKQARLIESLLVEQFEPETLEERRILCGDAYTFQGDERHVIFLSMVVSRGETRLTAQTAQSAVQRFNVAVSRAQDQLVVYHSVDTQDLKPECMRHRLLTHVRHPVRRMGPHEEHEFDSPFEEAVFRRLAERGYRVESQVKVGKHAYRIDLVVHGIDSKLAIECDGDRWHGPERFDADMARQRDLERVRWEFVRIAGSAFYRDADAALEPLWSALEERNIRPATGGEDAGSADGEQAVPPEELDTTGPPEPPHGSPPHAAQNTAAASETAESTRQQPSFDRHEAQATPQLRQATLDSIEPSEVPAQVLSGTLPDPREASTSEVKSALLALLAQHGPLPREYLMRRYARGANIGRVGRVVRESLVRVIQSGTRSGDILAADEMELRGSDPILRVKDTGHVRLRPIGDREFEEVPPSEWALAMRHLCGGRGGLERTPRDEAFRQVLGEYGFTSLTNNRRTLLDRALQLGLRPD